MQEKYLIEKDVFKKVYQTAENFSEALFVLDVFCKSNDYIEEIQNIHPILKYISNEAQTLHLYFINKKDSKEYEKIPFKM